METWQEKLKLTDYLSVELDVLKSDFVSKLTRHVEPGSVSGMFSDAFDVFSSSGKDYKGGVTSSGFKIKKRARLFSNNASRAIATGSYKQERDKLIVNVEINGFDKAFIFYFIFVTLFYLFAIVMGGFFWSGESELSVFPFIIIPFHALLMYGIPFFIMRRSVAILKRELEREFVFLTKK